MLYNDIHFVTFFLPVLLCFYLLNRSKHVWLKNVFLLGASYIFYSLFEPRFILVLLYVTLVNYGCIRLLEKNKGKKNIATGVVLSLLPLAFYKYTYFVLNDVLGIKGHVLGEIALPIGISFFTFQALSYTIDIYRGKETRIPSILEYSLYTAFFPTILSGPIERARTLMPQIRELQSWKLSYIVNGFQLFVCGLFQKIVVADRISEYVGYVYAYPELYGTTTILLAMVLYSIQIYCDFAGYSNMAIGVGRMLGFDIRKNFDFPYFSTSIRSFWKKWHISLTSWLTEYVYISLGGNRVKEWRWVVNVLTVFLVSGLWHGAAWTFVVWGMINGLYQIIEHYLLKKEYHSLVIKVFQSTLLFFIWSFSLVFFRSNSINHAIDIFIGLGNGLQPLFTMFATQFMLLVICLFIFFAAEVLMYKRIVQIVESYDNPYLWKNLCFTILLAILISLLGQSGVIFVYLQF